MAESLERFREQIVAKGGEVEATKLAERRKEIEHTENETAVLNMRRSGGTFDQIAKHLKMSVSGVYKVYKRAIKKTRLLYGRDVQEIKALELNRLDALSVPIWNQIHGRKTEIVDGREVSVPYEPEIVQMAVNTMLKIMDVRAKFEGLYERQEKAAPRNARAEAKRDLAPVLRGATLEELLQIREIAERSKQRAESGEAAE